MAVRRSVRNYRDNPQLQRALAETEQANPNAAAKNELASNIFAARYGLAERQLGDIIRQHGLESNLERRALRDTKSGIKYSQMFGLGELALGIKGSRDSKKAREEERRWRMLQSQRYYEGLYKNQRPFA